MSADIGPGDWVEATTTGYGLTTGQVYRCESLFTLPAPDICRVCAQPSETAVMLAGFGGPYSGTNGFHTCSLKPIYRSKPDAFAHLLKEPAHAS